MTDKYRNSTNIDARIELHDRFSRNSYGWHRWIFDSLQFPSYGSILELGCGPGNLWNINNDRLPRFNKLILSDQSMGMVAEARSRLNAKKIQTDYSVSLVEHIPFPENSFDVVISNHVLYYVDDLNNALSGIRQVLKPGGSFYSSTNGPNHLTELANLFIQFDPTLFGHLLDEAEEYRLNRFNLSNGLDFLSPYFSKVSMKRYEDALVVNEVEPLVPWAEFWVKGELSQGKELELREFLMQELSAEGSFSITKDSGIFVSY